MKKIINNKWFPIIIIYFIYLFISVNKVKTHFNDIKIISLFFGIFIISTIVFILSIKIFNKKYSEHKSFFLTAIVIGLIYMIFLPAIMGATDELPHFLRAYQISAGDIVIKNPENNATLMPEDLLEFSRYSVPLKIRYSKDNILKSVDYRKKVNLNNADVATGSYPLYYIPQITAIKIAKWIKLSPILTLTLVRMFNFILWALIMSYAIKIMPIHKKAISYFFISPAVLSLVSTSNMDSLPLALFVLLFGYIFKYKYKETKLTKLDKAIIAILCLFLSAYKLFYIVLLSFIILIPKKCFKNNKEKIIYTSIVLILSLIIDFIWYKLILGTGGASADSLNAEQISLVIHQPIYYIYVLLNSLFTNFYELISNLFAGHEMCYRYADINSILVISYMILYYIIIKKSENKNIKFNWYEKLYIIIILLGLMMLVATSMYLGWTTNFLGIGSEYIEGVQSRYFFVFIPVIVMMLKNNKKSKEYDKVYYYYLLFNILILMNTMTSVVINIVDKLN